MKGVTGLVETFHQYHGMMQFLHRVNEGILNHPRNYLVKYFASCCYTYDNDIVTAATTCLY